MRRRPARGGGAATEVLEQVIDRAAKDPKFSQRLSRDLAGTLAKEGYLISPAEVRAALQLERPRGRIVEELQARVSYAGGREP